MNQEHDNEAQALRSLFEGEPHHPLENEAACRQEAHPPVEDPDAVCLLNEAGNGQCRSFEIHEPDTEQDRIEALAVKLSEKLAAIEARLDTLADQHTTHVSELKSCLEVTAECQQRTSAIANSHLERHALEPAIKAVDAVTTLIKQIARHDVSTSDRSCCTCHESLQQQLCQAAAVAQEKCDSLEIESICPASGDEFDSHRHTISNVVVTADPQMHRKVHDTLMAGLCYRGKILKPATVSVYRFVNPSN